jgi:hypothetical protein
MERNFAASSNEFFLFNSIKILLDMQLPLSLSLSLTLSFNQNLIVMMFENFKLNDSRLISATKNKLQKYVTCHMRATTAIAFLPLENKTIASNYFSLKKSFVSEKIFCSAFGFASSTKLHHKIFKNFPSTGCCCVFHVSFLFWLFFCKWLNIIGNHLHTSEQAICD